MERSWKRRKVGEGLERQVGGESLIRGVDLHTCILPVELTPFH